VGLSFFCFGCWSDGVFVFVLVLFGEFGVVVGVTVAFAGVFGFVVASVLDGVFALVGASGVVVLVVRPDVFELSGAGGFTVLLVDAVVCDGSGFDVGVPSMVPFSSSSGESVHFRSSIWCGELRYFVARPNISRSGRCRVKSVLGG